MPTHRTRLTGTYTRHDNEVDRHSIGTVSLPTQEDSELLVGRREETEGGWGRERVGRGLVGGEGNTPQRAAAEGLSG